MRCRHASRVSWRYRTYVIGDAVIPALCDRCADDKAMFGKYEPKPMGPHARTMFACVAILGFCALVIAICYFTLLYIPGLLPVAFMVLGSFAFYRLVYGIVNP